jgi:hypothetical protein
VSGTRGLLRDRSPGTREVVMSSPAMVLELEVPTHSTR